jgi:RNA polymerase sigma factor (sigma-70 family)
MEAAAAVPSPLARARAGRFERECERLRPLGEAYVLRRFGGSLNRADAEDAVAEVLVRLHRMAQAGTPPQNLRATFFASVRNQAIDQLRSRAARPTVELDAAGQMQAPGPRPAEWAESREDGARLREALGRMRGNYREAIMLRFGLGMTVPEIAEHCEISLPAAKKLVLRATAQARKRMQATEASDFCPQMRELARQALLEKELSGVGAEHELALLRIHLSHCGSCRSFVATLHERLHDLGAAVVFGLAGAERLSAHLGVLDGLGHWGAAVLDGVQAGGARLRHVAYKAAGVFPSSDGSATGALLSTGQKIAAVCTAGAATTATCLLTGALGPVIATPSPPPDLPGRPPAQVREQAFPEPTSTPPAPIVPTPPSPGPEPEPPDAHAADPQSAPAPSQVVEAPDQAGSPAAEESEPTRGEFGIEGTSTSSPAPELTPAPAAPAAARSAGGPSSAEAGADLPAATGAGSTGSGVGFHG